MIEQSLDPPRDSAYSLAERLDKASRRMEKCEDILAVCLEDWTRDFRELGIDEEPLHEFILAMSKALKKADASYFRAREEYEHHPQVKDEKYFELARDLIKDCGK